MPTWENICSTVSRWTDKANAVADDLADRTATQIKLSTRRADLEKEYAALGKLTYQRLAPECTDPQAPAADAPSDLTEQINQAITRITAIRAEIAEIEKRAK